MARHLIGSTNPGEVSQELEDGPSLLLNLAVIHACQVHSQGDGQDVVGVTDVVTHQCFVGLISVTVKVVLVDRVIVKLHVSRR